MLLTEYNEAEQMRLFERDGYRNGYDAGHSEGYQEGMNEEKNAGIVRVVGIYRSEMHLDDDSIREKIISMYHLTEEEAEEFVHGSTPG